jgi:oligopeptide transport system ATP-binding protein
MSREYVKVRGLSVSYLRGSSLRKERFQALRKVSFEMAHNECFALVGESGSGKSTVARALLGLAKIDEGSGRIGSFTLPGLTKRQWREFRREVQVVFQDPYLSLNPRLSVGALIEEPLIIHGIPRAERKQRVVDVVRRVRLEPELLPGRPSQLSGGQRQRVCIARALVLRPRLLIADEPVSALDLSVQASIIDLLAELKEETGLTLLFISHDLELVQFIADRIGVLYGGRLVEVGSATEVMDNPLHPYTKSLLAAVPGRLSHTAGQAPASLPPREAPSLSGCPYGPNCSLTDMKCQYSGPPLVMATPTHRVACYKALAEKPPTTMAPVEGPHRGG